MMLLFPTPKEKKCIYLWCRKHTSINQSKLVVHLDAKFFCIIIRGIVVLLEYLRMHIRCLYIMKTKLIV